MALPSRNHTITLAQAAGYTRRHREQRPNEEKGGAFHADQVRALLAQPGCTALRYYHGLDENASYAMILAGVDGEDHDSLNGDLLEQHFPCPPLCALPNDLNADDPATARAARVFRTAPLALPPRDHRIALEAAQVMTRRWRVANAGREKGGAFHADQVLALLDQRSCLALRYYHGMDEAGNDAPVLVGVDPEGADMTDGILMELHFPCPPLCDQLNVLNSSGWVLEARRLAAVEVA